MGGQIYVLHAPCFGLALGWYHVWIYKRVWLFVPELLLIRLCI